MEKTVWADILFIVNFIINYLLLFSTAHITSLPFSRFRLFLSASGGALYAIFAFLPGLSFLTGIFGKLGFSFLMILIAFGLNRTVRAYLTFLSVSLLFGGAVFFASLLLPNAFSEVSGGVYYIHISFPALIITSLLAYLILYIIFMRRGAETSRRICTVTVKNAGGCVTLPTLLDTGNSLLDPATNARVLISDFSALKMILPPEAAKILEEHAPSPFALAVSKLCDDPCFKVIPYKTVGVSFSLLLTFRPEAIYIDGEISKNGLCAISDTSVGDGGGYCAII